MANIKKNASHRQMSRWEEAEFIKTTVRDNKKANPSLTYGVNSSLYLRFIEKVAWGMGECWYWVAGTDESGYGRMGMRRYFGENKAHRISYRLFKGSIPEKMVVMHTCDVRSCVNPDHLVLGTQKENVLDMTIKGRGVYPQMFGPNNPMAKLTTESVKLIKEMKLNNVMTQKEIAQYFRVSPMTISRAVRGISYNG